MNHVSRLAAIWIAALALIGPQAANAQIVPKHTAGQQRFYLDVKTLQSDLAAAVEKKASGPDVRQIEENDNQLIQLAATIMGAELAYLSGDGPKQAVEEIDRETAIRDVIELHDKLSKLYSEKHCRLHDACNTNH